MIGVVYLVVMFFGHLPDHLILFPTRKPIDAAGAVRKTVPFQNGELEVWTAQSRRAQQEGAADIFILRFYGNADRADRWAALEAEMWSDRAVEIWGMNYPGFGGSTGPARLSQIGPAALAALMNYNITPTINQSCLLAQASAQPLRSTSLRSVPSPG